ncbi:MAG: hypothetical protein IKH52_08480 [Bacteroidaceae bacterium]|nr:hypothetical protein [Bacteroidaceae bacterium]
MKEDFLTISGYGLTAVVSTLGAELQSLRDSNGREYNWQGTPPYWEGRGPILFPATGAPWNETYTIDGTAFKMPKHGFVKDQIFSVKEHTESQLVLEYKPTEETLAFFPFQYVLQVRFRFEKQTLCVDFSVENTDTKEIFFQIGGHPALAIPDFNKQRVVNGYVRLHTADTVTPIYIIRAREQGCIQPGRFPAPINDDGLIPICVDTFANEALIFEANQVCAIELLDANKQKVAMVESDAPCWLVWQMQDVSSPYVCFEPWYGLPDNEGESRELQKRPYVQQAKPGQTWHGGFTVKI